MAWIALAWALLGGVLGMGLGVAGLLLVDAAGGRPLEPGWSAVALTAPSYLGALAALRIGVLRDRPGHPSRPTRLRPVLSWADLGWRRPEHSPWHLLWQLPATLVAAAAVSALILLPFGSSSASSGQESISDMAAGGAATLVAGLLVVAVLVPLVEELVFRGIVLAALRARFTAVPGVALAGFVFAAAHVLPLALPYLLVVGVALALMAQWYRSILPGMVLHGVNNAVVLLAVMLPPD